MENLPPYISIVFILTTLLTVAIFYRAANYSRLTAVILLAWLALQSVIGLNGFYTVTNAMPPRLGLLILPPLVFIAILFSTAGGRRYLSNLHAPTLTLLHIVRIPVEQVLFWLYLHKTVPALMTFEGRNFDILSGITAPFIYYFGYVKKQLSRSILLVWNLICLVLLINIVITAVFSAPFPTQKFGFEQPNIAILYFPFIWLPCCVVPVVLLSHLATMRKLLLKNQ